MRSEGAESFGSCGSRLCIAINSSVSRGPGTTALRGFSRRTFQITHHRTEANALGHKPTRDNKLLEDNQRLEPSCGSFPSRQSSRSGGRANWDHARAQPSEACHRRSRNAQAQSRGIFEMPRSCFSLYYCFKVLFQACILSL